jgi:hypothetical protein
VAGARERRVAGAVVKLTKGKSRFFDSPPPNWGTFGAPFAQNDSFCAQNDGPFRSE